MDKSNRIRLEVIAWIVFIWLVRSQCRHFRFHVCERRADGLANTAQTETAVLAAIDLSLDRLDVVVKYAPSDISLLLVICLFDFVGIKSRRFTGERDSSIGRKEVISVPKWNAKRGSANIFTREHRCDRHKLACRHADFLSSALNILRFLCDWWMALRHAAIFFASLCR